MDPRQTHGSLTSIPERNSSTSTGCNLPGHFRRSSLVECYGGRPRQSLVELPATAQSWDDRKRLSLVYLDSTQEWSLAECSTLHSRSEEIDTSSMSCDMIRRNAPFEGPYQPFPSDGRQDEQSPTMLGSLTRRSWRAIILSQMMAILLSIITIGTIYLEEVYGHKLPTAMNLGQYAVLCAAFTSCLFCRKRDRGVLSVVRRRGWRYLLVAVVDVEANYLLTISLELTTLAITQLSSCVALLTATILSYLVLHARYRATHMAGLAMGFAGVGCLLWADILDRSLFIAGQDQLQHGLLYMSGTIMFASVTVVEEWAVNNFDPVEFLGMLGLFGTILCIVQSGILERSQLIQLDSPSWYEVAMATGYVTIQSTFTALTALVIHDAGATALHLSLVTSHFYLNLIKGAFLQQTQFHVLYTAHFIAVLLGIICFASKRLPVYSRSAAVLFPTFETLEKQESSGESTPLNNSSAA